MPPQMSMAVSSSGSNLLQAPSASLPPLANSMVNVTSVETVQPKPVANPRKSLIRSTVVSFF